jgi:hypothetical protein
MKTAAIMLYAILITLTAASASAQAVFPPLVAGEYAFRVRAADAALDSNGVPLLPATQAVGVFVVADPATILKCVDVAAGEIAQVNVVVPAVGERGEIKARAYEGTGCTGQTSPDSANSAFVYFVGPAAPLIVDPPPE